MLLVGIAARLVYMDMRRRTLQTAELRDQKLQLEREGRGTGITSSPRALSTHLQSMAERRKGRSCARVALTNSAACWWVRAWIFRGRSSISATMCPAERGDCAACESENLSAGVDLKRRIIEELRPHFALDNVGLFAPAFALATQGNLLPARASNVSKSYPRGRTPVSPPKPPSACSASPRGRRSRISSSTRPPNPWTSRWTWMRTPS